MAEKIQIHRLNSIWSLVSEDEFRQSLVALEQRTNAVPMDVQIFSLLTSPISISRSNQIPFRVEEQFVNDIAFIAAVNEGAQSVAAVYLEQHVAPHPKVLLRVAAADTIDANVRSAILSICNVIQGVVVSNTSVDSARGEVFESIITLHLDRILGRLRSSKWQKPKYLAASHKKPLWKDFANVVHRVHHIFPSRKERKQREIVEKLILELGGHYEDFEKIEESLSSLVSALIRLTYEFCKNQDIRDFYSKLNSSGTTAQISAALKCMHQLEKIGSYYRIANSLVQTAKLYPIPFSNIGLEYLTPYPTQPTTIAYESWAKTCHVHAEIQLVIDYDLRQNTESTARSEAEVYRPRVIGTSKYFCYLCYLFIKEHGDFLAANTHGRLYDQWTIPDIADYDANLRTRYVSLLARMAEIIQGETKRLPSRRPEPMTSRQNLLSCESEDQLHEDTTEKSVVDLAERTSTNLTI